MDNCSDKSMDTGMAVPQPQVPWDTGAHRGDQEARETVCYTRTDRAIAWVSLLLGYLFCRAGSVQERPFGGFLFVITIFSLAFWLLKARKVKLKGTVLGAGIWAVVISASLILTGNSFLTTLAYGYALASFCYVIYAALGNALEPGFSDFILMDYCKAVFMLPICSLFKIFAAMSQGKAKSGAKYLLKILCGIVIAIVPTAMILLLLSYDRGFRQILGNIFTLNFLDVISQVRSLILAVPVGMYLFGLYISSAQKRLRETVTAQSCRRNLEKVRILPQITGLTAALPILFLYVVYFISQWPYYVSGFSGVLPGDLSYAEYAREGFFQLCAVSVINLVIIVVINLFMRRGADRSALMLKGLTVVFCVFTLVLISTAVAKLVMYINCYGLTQKRIYAMWLMGVIAIVYIVTAVGLFVPRMKTVAVSAAVCVVLFGVLSVCNVNQITAEYNVDRYINGTLETVDLEAMEQLGDSAVPAMVRLAEAIEDGTAEDPDQIYGQLSRLLQDKAWTIENADTSIFEFTFPSYQAEKALVGYGFLE